MGTGQMLMSVFAFVLFLTMAQRINRVKIDSVDYVLRNQAKNDAMAYTQALFEQAFIYSFSNLDNLNGKNKTEIFGASKLTAEFNVYYVNPKDPNLNSSASITDYKVLDITVKNQQNNIMIKMKHIFTKAGA